MRTRKELEARLQTRKEKNSEGKEGNGDELRKREGARNEEGDGGEAPKTRKTKERRKGEGDKAPQ